MNTSSKRTRRNRLSAAIRNTLLVGLVAGLPSANAATLHGTAVPKLHLNAGAIDLATLIEKPTLTTTSNGKQLRVVQFSGPIDPRWHRALRDAGLMIVDYIPDYAYLVYGDAAAHDRFAGSAAAGAALWSGGYAASFKVSRQVYDLESRGTAADYYSIQLIGDAAANADTLDVIERSLTSDTFHVETSAHYVNVRAGVPFGALSMIADRADVISIQPDFAPVMLDERQNLILANRLSGGAPNEPIAPGAVGGVGYRDWLLSLGFTPAQFAASNFVVDISDSGLDNGSVEPNHFALHEGGNPGNPYVPARSLVVYNKREGSAAVGDQAGCGGTGHGTWVSHVVGGDVASVTRQLPHGDETAAPGFYFGGGVNPFVRMGNSTFFSNSGTFTAPDFENSSSRAYTNLGIGVRGARISNNSWGAAVRGAYNANAQAYDRLVRDAQPADATFPAPGNQQMVIVFAAGNSGSGAQTVGAPGSAKNVITAGGSQNVRPGVTGAADADAMYTSSSRGPAADARYKPDLLAPATNVSGGVIMQDRLTAAPGNYNTCYTGPFLPTSPQQQFYRTGNGTSFSSPAVAGAASLVRQWFINRPAPFHNAPPSPAMTKAFLTNAAQYMETLSDDLPSNNQGTGRMNLERTFDDTPRGLRDQLPIDRFDATGQTRTFTGTVSDTTRPFRVSLAWTDAPGSTTGAAAVNNLDLEVTVGGQTYRGNRFTGRNATAGATTADTLNNIESVFLPTGTGGAYTITVRATNIAGQGDPALTGPNQDFALVVYNTQPLNGCPAMNLTPATVPGTVTVGAGYPMQTFNAAGGTGPVTYFATGNLPNGTELTGNRLSGTVTDTGTFDFTVYGRDANGCMAAKGYQINSVSASVASTQTQLTSGNAIIEPNECNALNVRLTNNGSGPATSITATLSSTTPGVTITQATSDYSNLPPLGGTALNTIPFRISTDSTVACGSLVNLTQSVALVGGPSPVVFNFALPVGSSGGSYTFGTTGTGATIPSGGTLVGDSGTLADATRTVTLPADFSTRLYDTQLAGGTRLRASSNGNLQVLETGAGAANAANVALPAGPFGTTPTLFPFWDDLNLRTTGGGMYTHLIGTAPNRQFIVEWRGRHQSEPGDVQTVNFAIVLNEGTSGAFEYRYVQTGTAAAIANGASATVGIQASGVPGSPFTQSSLNQAVVTPGLVLRATLPPPVCNPGPGSCGLVNQVFSNSFE